MERNWLLKNILSLLLFKQDLLEQLGHGLSEPRHSQAATPLIDNVSTNPYGGAVQRDLGSGLFLGAINSEVSGRQTAPATHIDSSFELSRPLSASGGDELAGLRGGGAFDTGLDFGQLGHDMVRSRSAQPSLHESPSSMRPPPGLAGSMSPNSQADQGIFAARTSAIGRGIQRPASTSALYVKDHDGEAAFRPSAQTLMDLIQEDSPGEQQGFRQSYDHMGPSVDAQPLESPAARQTRGFTQAPQPQFAETQNIRQFQQENYNVYGRGTDTIPPQQSRYFNVNDARRHQPLPEEPRQTYVQMQQGRQVEIPQQQTQRYVGNMGRRNVQEEARNMYTTVQQQPQGSQQFLHQQQHPNQPLYYNAGPQQRVEAGLPMQQQQVLQSGQTLYVNTPGGQPGYSYATIQYQTAPGQQPQIIHQSIPSRGEQYVSVVPVQGGGQQLAYWPPDQQQQGMGPVTVMNSPGAVGGTMTMARLSDNHRHQTAGGGYGGGRHGRGGGADRGRGASRRNQHSRREPKNSSHSVSSPVLEEFRASKSRDWTVRQIEGYVVEFCQDQNGSRFIQQRLELGDPVEQTIVMKEVLPAIRRLRNDVFGNYVVQKLLDFGTAEAKLEIRKTLEGEMLQLSLQMYGCRVVQKALEALDVEDLPTVLTEFHHNVLSCIHDQNGNHVIQKCIEVLHSKAKKAEASGDPDRAAFLREQVDFIVNDVLVNTVSLSCHPYGCRVLQRILEHCDERKKTMVLDKIKTCHQKLLDDQYGNYVIQHVLQYGRDIDRDSILEIIAQNGLLGLARQKFASNVVEKLLKHGNGSQRRAIAREMLKVRESSGLSLATIPVRVLTDVCLLSIDSADCRRKLATIRAWRQRKERRYSHGSRCLCELRGANHFGCHPRIRRKTASYEGTQCPL